MSIGFMKAPTMTSIGDDPLVFLPRRETQRFGRYEKIYGPGDPANSLYLVIGGTVKLSRIAENGRETVLGIFSADSFFGESGLIGRTVRGELAIALEDSAIMEWTADDLAALMMRTPELGPSMLRSFAAKLYDADSRIESLATDQILKRLVKALLKLGEQFGDSNDSETLHLMPLTHEFLARYVGTSREIITQHMSQLRRKGLLEYSRSGINFNPAKLGKALPS